jgi:NAD(P)-dependent dehydrogenase (short-subunit alcohol dehydrogenase family)
LTGADSAIGKVAIVTGAASGIGLGIAQRLARAGAKVPMFDLNGDAADDAAAKLCQRFLRITTEAWNRLLAINLTGTFHRWQAVLPDMIAARWGRIVNISSSRTHAGQPYMAHYVASKSGVVGLTKSLALEFGSQGITVNTVPPGFIDTPMMRDAEAKGHLVNSIDFHATVPPARRPGRPEDIAAACAFLVSDEASYITGQSSVSVAAKTPKR